MPLSGFIQKAIKDFLIIFALIMIVITFLRQIYYPDMAFDLKSIYIIMGFSFLSTLTGFILYSPNNISDKNMRIRMVIHFITLEFILIAIASVFAIVDSVFDVIILALQIAVIYTLVRLLSWQIDKKEAQKMNEKLKAFKNDVI